MRRRTVYDVDMVPNGEPRTDEARALTLNRTANKGWDLERVRVRDLLIEQHPFRCTEDCRGKHKNCAGVD